MLLLKSLEGRFPGASDGDGLGFGPLVFVMKVAAGAHLVFLISMSSVLSGWVSSMAL